MHLCIDQGNSSAKVALFSKDELKENFIFKELNEKIINELFEKFNIKASIISSVSEHNHTINELLKERSENFIDFTHQTPIPIQNRYKSPQSLGNDRLAAVIGAQTIKPKTDSLVIDIGTAITYDFIDQEGNYWGGNISPGIDLRLKSLHHFTSRLPLVEMEEKEAQQLLGNDTRSAIAAGVEHGIIFEMDGYIELLKRDYPLISTFLTGRTAFFFANKLKNRIFANEFLVLIGLNRILQHNA